VTRSKVAMPGVQQKTMERERLSQLLDEPGGVGREDLAGLRALTERYPWFSGAHLLLAVGEHASGDVLFDDRLRTTAANVPSRAVVYDFSLPPWGALKASAESVYRVAA